MTDIGVLFLARQTSRVRALQRPARNWQYNFGSPFIFTGELLNVNGSGYHAILLPNNPSIKQTGGGRIAPPPPTYNQKLTDYQFFVPL
jgi:hypothetical protein